MSVIPTGNSLGLNVDVIIEKSSPPVLCVCVCVHAFLWGEEKVNVCVSLSLIPLIFFSVIQKLDTRYSLTGEDKGPLQPFLTLPSTLITLSTPSSSLLTPTLLSMMYNCFWERLL